MSTKQVKCSETYWPLLKEQLSSGKVSFNDLELPCPICYDTMGIQSSELVDGDTGFDHGATIIPCGHTFGYSCWRQAIEASKDDDINVCCPTCRANVVHPLCQHVHLGQKMPTCLGDLDRVAGPIKDDNFIGNCKNCVAGCYLLHLQEHLSSLPVHPELKTKLDIIIISRNNMYSGFPTPELTEEVPVPESVAKLFRNLMAENKKIESGELQDEFSEFEDEGAWCDEPLSDSVLKCYITGPPLPKPLPFWEYVEYRNLQDMRDGVAPKTLEELRAIYNDESYWGWLL